MIRKEDKVFKKDFHYYYNHGHSKTFSPCSYAPVLEKLYNLYAIHSSSYSPVNLGNTTEWMERIISVMTKVMDLSQITLVVNKRGYAT
jgi:hypothetical protein